MTASDLPVTYREHQALSDRVARVEGEQALLRSDLTTKLEGVTKSLNDLRIEMYRYRQTVLWRILGWGVSFLIGGGGVLGVLNAFHLLR